MEKTPNIIIWDIETLPLVASTFSLYPESIGHESILRDWSIVCAAWKKLGVSKVHSVSVLDDPKRFKKDINDDYHVVKTLRDMLQEVDILVHHNGDRFDLKKFNARLIFHGLDPLPKLLTVDTLKEVKKVAAFSSHRLDYLAKTLCGHGKQETSRGLWLRALLGDKKAIAEMVSYNKVDVKINEDVYLKLRPYMKSHPHIGAIEGWDKNHTCPKCGSDDLGGDRYRYTAAGIKKVQKQCKKCHSYSTFIFKPE